MEIDCLERVAVKNITLRQDSSSSDPLVVNQSPRGALSRTERDASFTYYAWNVLLVYFLSK